MKKNKTVTRQVGITSWGTALPYHAVKSTVIAESQGKSDNPGDSLGVIQKTCPAVDEDAATLAIIAAENAIDRLPNDFVRSQIGSLLIGSESHPYAVKPTGTIVAQALGLSENLSLADLQFACKAGTQSLQLVFAQIGSGQIEAGLAIGSDTAQSKPGDILEYTAGSGAGAYLLASDDCLPLVATLSATASIATDTPDFWRRTGSPYPEHAGRFSAEPAYFYHVLTVAKKLLQELDLTPQMIDYCVFHTPNAKFPRRAADILGFTTKQLQYSLPVKRIGNTYAAAVPLALANVLEHAKPEEIILVVSYGSGAGSDGFVFETTPHLPKLQKSGTPLDSQIDHLSPLSLTDYLRLVRLRSKH